MNLMRSWKLLMGVFGSGLTGGLLKFAFGRRIWIDECTLIFVGAFLVATIISLFVKDKAALPESHKDPETES